MARVFLVAFLAIVLAGCQTTFYDPGTTPLTVSPRVTKAFEKYKQADYPLFFAVATDSSSYAYYTCPSIHCLGPYDQDAIALCERRTAPGVECKIFAYDRQIVWKGPVTYAAKGIGAEPLPTVAEFDRGMKAAMVSGGLRESTDRTICTGLPFEIPVYIAEASRRGLTAQKCATLLPTRPAETPVTTVHTRAKAGTAPADARPFAITWDAHTTMAARTIELHLGKGRGTFRAPFGKTDVDCDGKYTVVEGKTGTWSVACPDGLTAAGTFVSYGVGKGARGVGLDSRGRKVRYTIGPR